MKILLIVPDLNNTFVEYILCKNNDADLVIQTFGCNTNVDKFDMVYVYPGACRSKISNDTIVDMLPDNITSLLFNNSAMLLLYHHYSCDYSAITLLYRVVTASLLRHPYGMLGMLSLYPVCEKHNINTGMINFIMMCNSTIVCFVAGQGVTDDVRMLMPVIPTGPGIQSNFNIQSFLNCDYFTIEQIKELGDQFWNLQFYHVWDSFYDQVYR
jgi:hypothetical protein